jgi:hypothetical protein
MFRFGLDDILRVINEKVNPSSLNESAVWHTPDRIGQHNKQLSIAFTPLTKQEMPCNI